MNGVTAGGETPFCLAAAHAQLAILELLHEAGADIRKPNNKGRTGVHLAAIRGHTKVLAFFIRIKEPLNMPDPDGLRPIHHCCIHGHGEALLKLIKAGVPLDQTTADGLSPLMMVRAHVAQDAQQQCGTRAPRQHRPQPGNGRRTRAAV